MAEDWRWQLSAYLLIHAARHCAECCLAAAQPPPWDLPSPLSRTFPSLLWNDGSSGKNLEVIQKLLRKSFLFAFYSNKRIAYIY